MRPVSFLLAASACLLPLPSMAWGRTAHEVVGFLAEEQLSPNASVAARRLLHGEHLGNSDVAGWADDVAKREPATARWHYVNIPLAAGNYVAERDCRANGCVVARIEQFRAELADRKLSPEKRGRALKFLVHLVADAQQPLHCVDNHDRGGNDVTVRLGRHSAVSLHEYWDSRLVAEDMKRRSLPMYERFLRRDITAALQKQFSNGTVKEWVEQCHGDGATIYDRLKINSPRQVVELPKGYADSATRDVEVDLERASIRLAQVINQALGDEPPPAIAAAPRHRGHRQRRRF